MLTRPVPPPSAAGAGPRPSPLAEALAALRAHLQLGRHAHVGRGARVLGRVWAHGGGSFHLGEGVILDGRQAPIELKARRGAAIVIDAGAVVEAGASLEAVALIHVGAGARVGAFCKLLDNHLHPLRGDRHRTSTPSLPLEVGAGAVLGARAIVLPGAVIPPGAAVPPGTVVRPRPGAARQHGDAPATAPDPTHLLYTTLRRARRAAAFLRARLLLRRCQLGRRVFAYGPVEVVAGGLIRLGDGVGFMEGRIPARLVCHPGATLTVGEGAMFNYGAEVEAYQAIRIGRGSMFASGVRVCDRGEAGVAPITVGDEVWVAHGATLLPGVTVGDGSVVAAGAVVTQDVPAGSLAIGNPARCMSLSLLSRA